MSKIGVNANVLLDTLIWSTCRYCIGRHSYVSSYASDIWRLIKEHRTEFDEGRLMFLARDIRACVSEYIASMVGIRVEWRDNSVIVHDAYTLLCKYLMEHPDVDFQKGTFNINCITGVVEYKDNGEEYRFRHIESLCSDLVEWVKLADAIDRQVVVSIKETKIEILCVKVIEGRPRANGRIDWKISYCPVNYHWNTSLCIENLYKINGKKLKKK